MKYPDVDLIEDLDTSCRGYDIHHVGDDHYGYEVTMTIMHDNTLERDTNAWTRRIDLRKRTRGFQAQ
jgi:hypothetical protein